MKAVAVFPTEKRFEVIDHPEPSLTGPDEVKMKVLEVGVCGTDKEIAAFEYGWPPDGSQYLILGHESLTQVVDVGKNVKGVKPGDLVVPTVRRPCGDPGCAPCKGGRQDFCSTFKFTERGINHRHGFMSEFLVVGELPDEFQNQAALARPCLPDFQFHGWSVVKIIRA